MKVFIFHFSILELTRPTLAEAWSFWTSVGDEMWSLINIWKVSWDPASVAKKVWRKMNTFSSSVKKVNWDPVKWRRSKMKNSFTLAIGWHLLVKDYTFIGISYAIKGIVQALLLDLSRRSGSTLASNIFSLILSFTLFTLSAKCGTPSVIMCVSIAGISSIGFAKLWYRTRKDDVHLWCTDTKLQ